MLLLIFIILLIIILEPWIMAVAGKVEGGAYSNHVEVLSTDPKRYPVPGCVQFPKTFPEKVPKPMGAAVQDGKLLLVCGGQGGSGKCYTYDSATDNWVAKGSLPRPVGFAAFSRHKTLGLLMTGGFFRGEGGKRVSYDQLVSTPDGKNFRASTQLPYADYANCHVLIDDRTLMVLGTGDKVYQINLVTGKSTKLPWMPGGARDHVCGVGERVVVVAGVGSKRDGTYIFDLQTKKWRIGMSELLIIFHNILLL